MEPILRHFVGLIYWLIKNELEETTFVILLGGINKSKKG